MNKNDSDNYAIAISLWGIQEALLQQYRTIFITMQSIFIAVAASVFQRTNPWLPMSLLFALAMFTLWLWLSTCNKRGRAVYFCQFLALKAEAGEIIPDPLKTLKDLEAGELLDTKITRDALYLSLFQNKLRTKMQVMLPWVFVGAWVLLWIDIFWQHWFLALIPR